MMTSSQTCMYLPDGKMFNRNPENKGAGLKGMPWTRMSDSERISRYGIEACDIIVVSQ
jgi:hypothetical protein